MDNQQESTLLVHPLDSDYFVSVDGKIYSKKRGNKLKELKQHLHKGRGRKPYLRVRVMGRLFLVHRFIACLIIGREIRADEQVNHLDGDTLNNNLDNLEVVSFKENVAHAVVNNLYCSGEDWYAARR